MARKLRYCCRVSASMTADVLSLQTTAAELARACYLLFHCMGPQVFLLGDSALAFSLLPASLMHFPYRTIRKMQYVGGW